MNTSQSTDHADGTDDEGNDDDDEEEEDNEEMKELDTNTMVGRFGSIIYRFIYYVHIIYVTSNVHFVCLEII